MARVCDLDDDCRNKASVEVALSLDGKSYRVDICREHGQRLVDRSEEVVPTSLVTDPEERKAMLAWLLERKLITHKKGKTRRAFEEKWIAEGRPEWLQKVEAQKSKANE